MQANLDIGTEQLRWMGEPRFLYGGLREVLRGQAYQCRVAYRAADEEEEPGAGGWADEGAGGRGGQDHLSGMGHGASSSSSAVPPAASALGGGTRLRPLSPTGPHLPLNDSGMTEALLPAASKGSGGGSSSDDSPVPPREPSQNTQGSAVAVAAGCSGEGTRLSDYPAGPPLHHLPALLASSPAELSSALPPGWQLLPATDLNLFGAYNTQYIALKARVNPAGTLSSGSWDLQYVSGLSGWSGRMQVRHPKAELKLK